MLRFGRDNGNLVVRSFSYVTCGRDAADSIADNNDMLHVLQLKLFQAKQATSSSYNSIYVKSNLSDFRQRNFLQAKAKKFAELSFGRLILLYFIS